jgi:hypothetical protein
MGINMITYYNTAEKMLMTKYKLQLLDIAESNE